MLTFFTTGKPFVGHSDVIQRNALKSWTLVHPDAEVILFGDDEGSAEAANQLGIRHEPRTEKNQAGSNRVDDMFARAQAIARHDVLCYSNCDIIFTQDFRQSVERVLAVRSAFLIVGRRWDTEITRPRDFANPDWRKQIRNFALLTGRRRTPDWVDYFVFTRGLFTDLPPFAVGRVYWDHWMVWNALERKKPVIDASRTILAIHQNHDYRHHPQGKAGVWYGEEAAANYRLAGGSKHLRTIADATHVLRADRLVPSAGRHLAAVKRHATRAGRITFYSGVRPLWFFLLDLSRPIRSAVGLRSAAQRRSRDEV
jgi:hypothetical protein